MQNAGSFKCPQCAAPVPFLYGQHAAVCEYCGNTVVVPAELRPPPPPPQQPPAYQYRQVQIVINGENVYDPSQVPYTPAVQTVQRRRSSTSCVAVVIFLIVLLFIAGGVLSFLAASTPFFFDNLMGGGFARLEQTYSAESVTPAANGDSVGTISDAVDVAVDKDGNVYVVTYDGWLARFTADGSSINKWRLPGDDIHPDSVAADNAGNVYVTYGTDIHKFEGATGQELSTIPGPSIFGVSDLAIAPDGSLLSFLGGNLDQIIRIDPTGQEVARYPRPITEYSPGTSTAPWLVRIATDSDGKIYLLHTTSTSTPIFIYSPEGKHIAHFGDEGTGDSEISSPGAIAVDSKGRIYVSDMNAVKVFDQEGEYVGIIRMPFSYRASGLAFDNSDRLYVAARNESKIYRFVLNEP